MSLLGPFISRLQQFDEVKGFHLNRIVDALNSVMDLTGTFAFGLSNGHLVTTGATPTLSNVNGSLTVNSIHGNDVCGVITYTSASGGLSAGASLFKVNFANAYGATPSIQLADNLSPGAGIFYQVATPSINGFTINTGSARAGSTQYACGYLCLGFV